MLFLFAGIGELPLWQQALRGIGIFFCKFIYWLISCVFQLFITVSRVNILSSDSIAPIYQRVTMILTIVMTFYITFEFVKYVVQPDIITDKEKGIGNIGFKVIIVILLIAFVPKFFSLGYSLQNKIIENQVLPKIILGKVDQNFDTYGSEFSANMFGLFYKVDEETCGNKCDVAEKLVNYNLEKLRAEGTTKYLDDSINESNKVKIDGETKHRPIIAFDGIMAILVGGFIIYILILYSINIGTRYAQLIFLQIMAPVAILGYLSPKKDNMLQKWTKQCFTTYLDLFIRLGIIYFILLLVQVLDDAFTSGMLFEGLENISPTLKVFTYIVLIMGLLLFANKAPKMLQEIFPSIGGAAGIGFGLKAADRVAPMAARVIGSSTSGITGLARGAVTRTANAYRRNKRIKDEFKEQGKPYKRKDIRKAVRDAKREERAARRAYDQNRDGIGTSKNALDIARTKLEQARKNNRPAEEIAKLEKDARDAQNQYDRMMNYKNNFNTAKSKLAQAENESYGTNAILQGIGAGISGLTTGIKTGFSATKLNEIGKKIGETSKKINEKELAQVNWLEEGGGATIDAAIKKEVTKIQKKFGIKTESDKIKLDVKRMESEVKKNDAQATLYSTMKAAGDDSIDRSKSKITSGEQKIKVTADSKAKGGLLEKLELAEVGDTTSDVYAKYLSAENMAKSVANSAETELTKYRVNAKTECDKRSDDKKSQIDLAANNEILKIDMNANQELSQIDALAENEKAKTQNDSSLSEEQKAQEIQRIENERQQKTDKIEELRSRQKEMIIKQKLDQEKTVEEDRKIQQENIEAQIKDMEDKVNEKYAAASKASAKLQEALKQLGRHGVDQAMKGDTSDAVLVTKTNTMRQALDNLRNNYESNGFIGEMLSDDQDLLKDFRENNIVSWENYDKIQGMSTSRSSQIKDENSIIKEAIRSINESSYTDAANANNNATGSGKK